MGLERALCAAHEDRDGKAGKGRGGDLETEK